MKERERKRELCNLTCLNTKNFECSGASRLAQPQQWNSDRLVPGKSGPKAPNAFPEWKMKGRSKQTLLKRPAETVNSNWVDGWKNTNESRNRSGRQVFWWHRRRRRRRLLKGSKSFVLPQCANKRRRSIHLHCTSFPKMKTQFRLTWSPQIKKTLLSKVSAFYAFCRTPPQTFAGIAQQPFRTNAALVFGCISFVGKSSNTVLRIAVCILPISLQSCKASWHFWCIQKKPSKRFDNFSTKGVSEISCCFYFSFRSGYHSPPIYLGIGFFYYLFFFRGLMR